MNRQQRNQFRKSKAWKQLKYEVRMKSSKDYITKEPLVRDWNLHHLDLNVSRYDNISDTNKFMPLNPDTHKLIHELYKLYKKHPGIIDRIKDTLERMDKYTNEA